MDAWPVCCNMGVESEQGMNARCPQEVMQCPRTARGGSIASTCFVVEAKVLTHFSGGADGADVPLHYEGLRSCCHCDLH